MRFEAGIIVALIVFIVVAVLSGFCVGQVFNENPWPLNLIPPLGELLVGFGAALWAFRKINPPKR